MAAQVKQVTVSTADRAELERRVRSQTGSARDAKRARIVLLAAEGRSGLAITELVGVSEPTVIKWRRAYAERGLDQDRRRHPRQTQATNNFSDGPLALLALKSVTVFHRHEAS